MSACEAPGATSIRVALNLPFPAGEAAACLLSSEVAAYWIGRNCSLSTQLCDKVSIPFWTFSQAGRVSLDGHRGGEVVECDWPGAVDEFPSESSQTVHLVIRLEATPAPAPAPSPSSAPALGEAEASGDPTPHNVAPEPAAPPPLQRVSFRLSARTETSSRLRIEHSGLPLASDRKAALKLWQGALRRLERLMVRCMRSFRHDRQAVILVHGIGEQRPGQLLREFVSNVFDDRAGERYFVKPDLVSSLFEMRMASVPRIDAQRPTTDVYELYWAHLIRDTTPAQVYGWILRLVLSKDSQIPKTLVRLVWIVRVLFVAALAVVAWLATKDIPAILKVFAGGAFVALPGLLGFAMKALRDEYLVNFAGDAARYLEPRAGNVSRRQEIREAGAKLIEALHEKRRYERIIVYAHSLGSVIAYDILSNAWARHSRTRDPVQHTSSKALRTLEDLVNDHSCPQPAPDIDAIQTMQHAAWTEYRRNGFQWRVTDFVTVGSPLAHARWLLNLDAKTRFADLVRERTLPTCPPVTEDIPSPAKNIDRKAFTFTHAYADPDNSRAMRSVLVPHHGGVFALTRWTILFFPYRGLVDGDPVAGPVVSCFGHWVKDVSLRLTKGFAHGRYTDRAHEPEAVNEVRRALNLPMRRPLAEHLPEKLHPTVLQ